MAKMKTMLMQIIEREDEIKAFIETAKNKRPVLFGNYENDPSWAKYELLTDGLTNDHDLKVMGYLYSKR